MRTIFGRFRAVVCLSTALMTAVSWPLWVSGGPFPKVPFVGGIRLLPVWASWLRLGALLAAMVAAAAWPWMRKGEAGARASLAAALAMAAWMVLEDQFRLQPWMYQFLLMGLAMAACPAGQAMSLCRLLLIAMYFHSGLSKLDAGFVRSLGAVFLDTAAALLRMPSRTWPDAVRVAAILAMPAWELMVAIGLAFRGTRGWALIGAVLQHAFLIAILGPSGLDHSANVLIWNAATALEVVLLFRTAEASLDPETATFPRLAGIARFVFVLAILLPFGERAGLWDAWPSFALYSGHDERIEYAVAAEDLDAYPASIRCHFQRAGGVYRLNVGRWSLAERRAPAYPGGRALNGVAEALAARYRGPRPARLVRIGRAERMTGRASRVELLGVDAIRRHGDSYLLNAHPAP